ncbi:MAG TPA: response regulator [Methylomirabilota bacterium]|nr:response regulator [Methylomirabilota bacterium]
MDRDVILVAEDNEDDAFFMRRAFDEAGLRNPFLIVPNGQAAINYLAGVGDYRDRTKYPQATFVFLDLKMPFKSGFDVLAWLKERRDLKVRAAVLSSSPEERDMARARELGAVCYLIKPPTPEMLKSCWEQFELS